MQQENRALKRENEQLQMMVGFLTQQEEGGYHGAEELLLDGEDDLATFE